MVTDQVFADYWNSAIDTFSNTFPGLTLLVIDDTADLPTFGNTSQTFPPAPELRKSLCPGPFGRHGYGVLGRYSKLIAHLVSVGALRGRRCGHSGCRTSWLGIPTPPLWACAECGCSRKGSSRALPAGAAFGAELLSISLSAAWIRRRTSTIPSSSRAAAPCSRHLPASAPRAVPG